jgi:hypothetical protein
MHTYVDDVVVKTKQSGMLLDDLKETFANLRRYRMKLNPEKCTFGMPAGVTTQDFINFWGKIFVFILLVLIENLQGFKTF